MAGFTFLLAMPAFQNEACLGTMIETLPVQRDEREFGAAMFRMAARTIRPVGGTLAGTRVKARARFQSALDFNVTLEAFQTAPCKIVARCTFGDTPQARMSLRQRTRCYLRPGDTAAEYAQSREQERNLP